MTPPRTLLFTANSPGEIAGWLRPLVREARRRWPETRIAVILLPCTFASGSEGRVAQDLVGVDEVVPASRYLDLLLRGGARYQPATLVHLGGDLMYAAFLAWRWRMPAWAYLWGRWWWDGAFRGYFVKDERGVAWLERRRVPTRKAAIVGDLVADAVEAALEGQPPAPRGPGRKVSFLPGSRAREVEALTPFYLEVAERLAATRADLEFQMLLSPFIPPDLAERLLQAPPAAKVGGVPGRLEDGVLTSPAGVRMRIVRTGNQAALAGSELAITIPGTKTAEAGCLGVPQLVVVPMNRPELVPYGGLLGLLDWVPGGEHLKGRILMRVKEKAGLLAQPNLLAGRALLPEMVGVLTPEQVATQAGSMLDAPEELRLQASLLKDLYGPSRGAAQRIFARMEARTCPTSP